MGGGMKGANVAYASCALAVALVVSATSANAFPIQGASCKKECSKDQTTGKWDWYEIQPICEDGKCDATTTTACNSTTKGSIITGECVPYS